MKSIIYIVLAIAVAGVDLLPQNRYSRHGGFDLIREMCKKKGVEEKYDDVKNAVTEFTECVDKLVDTKAFQQLFREALENNVVDAGNVTHYCSKIPQYKSCSNKFMEGMLPCADEEIRNYFTAAKNSENQLLEYICYENGDRIIKFVNEGGFQCFHSFGTLSCLQSYVSFMSKNIETLTFSISEFCPVLNELHNCMNLQLATCKVTTVSNMFEAVVQILSDGFSCKEKREVIRA